MFKWFWTTFSLGAPVNEALDVLKGAKYFCSLDLAHGFSQIPMEESDNEKTAFRTGTSWLYEYIRMPFGLCNAPFIEGKDPWSFESLPTGYEKLLV